MNAARRAAESTLGRLSSLRLAVWARFAPLFAAALCWLATSAGWTSAQAQTPSATTPVTKLAQPAPAQAASAPSWSSLSAARKQALAPLEPTWDSNDAPRKKKWIEVADRFPRMPADERQRVQQRMAAWAAMAPSERAQARLQFQETRNLGAEERQARWQAYQALPEDERKRLALAAKPGSAASSTTAAPATVQQGPSQDVGQAKRNMVAAAPSPAPRSVSPAVVQAKPGASTTTVATTAKPPLHHQPGLPKIVATPNFVDPTTLLPRRGPQAAAMRTAASSDPTRQP